MLSIRNSFPAIAALASLAAFTVGHAQPAQAGWVRNWQTQQQTAIRGVTGQQQIYRAPIMPMSPQSQGALNNMLRSQNTTSCPNCGPSNPFGMR